MRFRKEMNVISRLTQHVIEILMCLSPKTQKVKSTCSQVSLTGTSIPVADRVVLLFGPRVSVTPDRKTHVS